MVHGGAHAFSMATTSSITCFSWKDGFGVSNFEVRCCALQPAAVLVSGMTTGGVCSGF